jgi:Trk K+ transport system NAD-binding subunit
VALFVCAAIVIIFSSSGIVKFVASLSDFGYLMGLGIINYSVIPLHRKMPNLRRPFQTRLFPLIPIIGVITTWVFVPALEPRSFLLGGLLTIIGAAIYLTRAENRAEIRKIPKMFAGKIISMIARLQRKRMRVLIISGKRQAQNIANRLLAKDEYRMMFRSAEHQVTFIEEDEALCKHLGKRFNSPIFQGDGTKKDILEQVGVENIDVVIAASEDDGQNVIAALQARQLGWKQVIAIVQEPEYAELLEKNDVRSISAPWATAAMVENLLDRPALAQLFEFGIGAASLLDVTVPAQAEVSGCLIRDIRVPIECVIAAIIRDNTFVVPRGDTKIRVDDRVIFIGPAAAIRKSCDMFAKVK